MEYLYKQSNTTYAVSLTNFQSAYCVQDSLEIYVSACLCHIPVMPHALVQATW